MREDKASFIILFILFALPIPLSMLTWAATFMSLLGILGIRTWLHVLRYYAYFLAGSYGLTYGYAFYATRKRKALCFDSFLPLFHIAAFFMLYRIVEVHTPV